MNTGKRLALALSVGFAVLLAAVSCMDKARIIPDKVLSEIFADMLVADQWIGSNALTRDADTVMVYEPILNKYGYSTPDLYATIDMKMYSPSKFALVVKESQMILAQRADNLDIEIGERSKQARKPKYEHGYTLSGVGCSCDSLLLHFDPKTRINPKQ